MTVRNVDLPEVDYTERCDAEANRWVEKDGTYGGSVEALAFKQAFVLGANTSALESHGTIRRAMLAGRDWGRKPVLSKPRTVEVSETQEADMLDAFTEARNAGDRYSNDEEITALQNALMMALGLLGIDEPDNDDDDEPEVDPDLHRKQLAEDPDAF